MPAKTEPAKQATFDTDDKRAQYARLVVFNFGVEQKLIPKGKDVNSASVAELQKAFKALNGGNMLDGKGGIEEIQKLSKAGATDANVAERGLTTAYAQEVRPFLRKGKLSAGFARRGKPKAEKPAAAASEPKAAAKKNTAKTTSRKRSSAAPAAVGAGEEAAA